MMKSILFIILIVFLTDENGIAQNSSDRIATFRPHQQDISSWVELYHYKHYNGEFTKYNKWFHCLGLFNVDTGGNVINVQIVFNDSLPLGMSEYLKSLIKTTTTFWLPEVNANKVIVSDTIVCEFYLRNKNETDKERNKIDIFEFETEFEKVLSGTQEKSVFFKYKKDITKNYCSILLKI